MANTLTGLLPTIYEGLDIVSRELVGFIPAVARDVSADRVQLNQTILVPITTAQPAQTITPGVTPPNDGDQTVNNVSMTISQSQYVSNRWNGEEQKGQINAGNYAGILRNQFAQAFRTLTNAIELNLFQTAYQGASRATGTAGTTPFGTAGDLSDLANVRQVLDDNGVPQSDLHLVLGSAATATLRGKQSLLLKVNESGSSELLRNGSITALPVEGFQLHTSNQVKQVVKGTGASYVTSGSTAVGVKNVALVTGTGTVLAGDVVTFAADTANKYVANVGIAAPGTITLGDPGARVVIATANAMTIGNNYTPNVAFHNSAIQLITRVPATPLGPNGQPMDLADDAVLVTDPVSGLTFEVALYRGFMQMTFHVRIAWGYAAIKPEHIAIMMG